MASVSSDQGITAPLSNNVICGKGALSNDHQGNNIIRSKSPSQGKTTPLSNDIICGRGALSNNHQGNNIFRSIISKKREIYCQSARYEKAAISRAIVHVVMKCDPKGRFLDRDHTGNWYEISHDRATEKTSQALRERGKQHNGTKKDEGGKLSDEVELIVREKIEDIEKYIAWSPGAKKVRAPRKRNNDPHFQSKAFEPELSIGNTHCNIAQAGGSIKFPHALQNSSYQMRAKASENKPKMFKIDEKKRSKSKMNSATNGCTYNLKSVALRFPPPNVAVSTISAVTDQTNFRDCKSIFGRDIPSPSKKRIKLSEYQEILDKLNVKCEMTTSLESKASEEQHVRYNYEHTYNSPTVQSHRTMNGQIFQSAQHHQPEEVSTNPNFDQDILIKSRQNDNLFSDNRTPTHGLNESRLRMSTTSSPAPYLEEMISSAPYISPASELSATSVITMEIKPTTCEEKIYCIECDDSKNISSSTNAKIMHNEEPESLFDTSCEFDIDQWELNDLIGNVQEVQCFETDYKSDLNGNGSFIETICLETSEEQSIKNNNTTTEMLDHSRSPGSYHPITTGGPKEDFGRVISVPMCSPDPTSTPSIAMDESVKGSSYQQSTFCHDVTDVTCVNEHINKEVKGHDSYAHFITNIFSI